MGFVYVCALRFYKGQKRALPQAVGVIDSCEPPNYVQEANSASSLLFLQQSPLPMRELSEREYNT